MTTETLATLVRNRRERLGISQGELADRIGTSRAYMSQIESGKTQWPQNLVPALARELGASQVELAVAAGLIEADAPEPNRANPFDRDDPRYPFVETLKRLDLSDEYDAWVAVTTATQLRTMIAGREQYRQDALEVMRALRSSPKGTVAKE